MVELAAEFEKKQGSKVVLQGGGATKGIRQTADGTADIGGSCRNKIDLAEEEEANMVHVAWDAVVAVTSTDNGIDNTSTDHLKKVLKGEITSWSELVWEDLPVAVYVRESKLSGVRYTTSQMLFNNAGEEYSPDAEVMKSSGPLEKAIVGDITGIGVTGVSSAKRRNGLKILSLDGVAPTKENIINGSYTMVRPLYVVTQGMPNGEVKAFIDLALSDACPLD